MVMTTVVLYGELLHLPLLEVVLGRDPRPGLRQVRLDDHAVRCAEGTGNAVLVCEPGASAGGYVLAGLNEDDLARIDFYQGAVGYRRETWELDGVAVEIYRPVRGRSAPGRPWRLDEWKREHGELAVEAAREAMSYFGRLSAEQLAARMPMIAVRAASALRARAAPMPRFGIGWHSQADVRELDRAYPYSKFFAVADLRLRHRTFAGAMGAPVERAVFMAGDAVTVLPYDPARDRVLIVEQFRSGPYARGDAYPWKLEPVAGRIDPGEDHERAARRETGEETGLEIGTLHRISAYYPSPGGVSEYLFSYIGIAELPDGTETVAGLEDEAEDIRTHVLSRERLLTLVTDGTADNAPLILSALWLDRNRDRLAPPP